MRNYHAHPRAARGFTLIELSVVLFIVALVAAVAFPQFIAVVQFSKHEGAARQLANFGRGVLAEAQLMGEHIIVRFDLGSEPQTYHAVRLIIPDEGEGESETGEDETDQIAILESLRGKYSPDVVSTLIAGGNPESEDFDPSDVPEEFDGVEADAQIANEFNLFARRGLLERAKNVKHDESISDEIGPLFDGDFSLEDDVEPIEDPIVTPPLGMVEVDPEIRIASIDVGGVNKTGGVVEVELTALGLREEVRFYIADLDDNYYTVKWDPVSNSTNILEGKNTED